MSNRMRSYASWQILLLLLILGGIIGGWLGEFIAKLWPAVDILGRGHSIGIPTFSVNLQFFTVSFGFMFNISFLTIVGFILAYLIYKRL